MKNFKVRIPMYFIGLFIMTIGIALSVKSNLGVSPVSSIPYTMTCVWGIEMGKATILFHIVLVLIQIVLLRKAFKIKNLAQVLIGIVFGYFTTFCNYLVTFFPTPDNLIIRISMVLVSTVLVGLGIFLYLPADLIPLAGEGAMQAVSHITGIEFSKVKIGFDCTMVLVSAVTCLTLTHSLGSVGAGTILAAVLVGCFVGLFTKMLGAARDRLLGKDGAEGENAQTEGEEGYPVITISREFGSGGREIGKLLAKQLGYAYYDSELIRLAAEKSGYTPDFVEKNEQALKNPILHDFFAWYASPVEKDDFPKIDRLYEKEAEVIREIAAKEPCVIVGRLANYILKDSKKAYHVFVSASEKNEILRVAKRDGISDARACDQVRQVNHQRAVHCHYFTKTEWGNAKNYNLCVRSDDLGIEGTAALIRQAAERRPGLEQTPERLLFLTE